MSNISNSKVDVATSPPSYTEGDQYVDPGTGALYVGFDNGSGGDYHPVPPIQVTQEASTFDESGLSVTLNKTAENGSQIGLIDGKYDISPAAFNQSFSISGEDANPFEVGFNGDGSKLYISGNNTDSIYSYNLSTAYDISTATYNQSLDVSSETAEPHAPTWNGNGTKMFMVGTSNANVYSYSLSTAYDISTASYLRSYSVGAEEGFPQGMAWNGNGTKMYVTGNGNGSVYSYSLSTAYDISTASYLQSFDVGTEDIYPQSLTWNGDGTKMYIIGTDTDSIYSYTLSTAYDISTCSLDSTLSVGSETTSPTGIVWNGDGSKVYISEHDNSSVISYVAESKDGNVVLSWTTPSDIEAYDLVTFQETLDTETISVDVEDSAGTVLFSDVGKNFDISTVSTSKDVRLRVYISRTDVTNAPTLDYAARRLMR